MFSYYFPLAQLRSQDVAENAGLLCDKRGVFGDNIKDTPAVIFFRQPTVDTGCIRKCDRRIILNATEKREKSLKEIPQMWAHLAKLLRLLCSRI